MERTQRLQLDEGILSRILATLEDVAFSCSVDGSRLRYISPSIRKLVDVPAPDADAAALWQGLLESVHGNLLPPAAISGGPDTVDTTVELLTVPGRTKWVRIRSRYVPADGSDGGTGRVDGLITDVSAQLAAQLDREQAHSRLALVERALRGSPSGAFTLEDITESYAAQRQLAEWTQRMDAVFTMSPDGFACFNAEGRLVALNPAMSNILGVGQYEPLGWDEARFAQRIVGLMNPGEQVGPGLPGLVEGLPEPASAVPDIGATMTPLPLRIELAGPPRRVLRMQVRQSHGSVAGKVVYLHDVTREFDLDRLKSEFLSTAAHELRTPMASLLGYTELLRDRKLSPETEREVFGIIHRQAKRLGRLLDDLLDLARIEAYGKRHFRFRSCRVQDIVHEAIDAMAADGSEREVDARLPDQPLWVRADPEKLLQALLNVLSNAYKYSPPDSQVQMNVVVSEGDGIPAGVSILVTDEGDGMRPEDVERAFERFFRADNVTHVTGSGLGLSLVKEIVEAHGGSVSLRSERLRGTEVTIRLPLVQPEAPARDADDTGCGALPNTTDPAPELPTGEISSNPRS